MYLLLMAKKKIANSTFEVQDFARSGETQYRHSLDYILGNYIWLSISK